MRVLNRLRRNDDGAVLVWVSLMVVTLVGMGALAIDVGYTYTVKNAASATADAASLAGAQAAAQQRIDSGGCAGVEGAADAAANDMVDVNDVPGTVTADPDSNCTNSKITVKVDVTSEVPTFLGSVWNVDSMDTSASATAEVVGTYGGLRPLSICGNDAGFSGGIPAPGVHQTVYPKSNVANQGNCGGASGNFGYVQFPDGNGSTGWLEEWITNGYTGSQALSIPGTIQGNTGANFNPITGEMDDLINSTNDPSKDVIVLLPVYSGWSGKNGNNATLNVTGVVSVKICGYATSHKAQDVGETDPSCWSKNKFLDPAQTPQDNPKFVFQWQYVGYVASYQSGGTCPLSVCTPSVRLVE